MTLDEAIKHEEEMAEEQRGLYRLCPASESEIFHCYGNTDCKLLKNGKNKGCLKRAEEHRQHAEWLKELREQTRWIPCSERLPNKDGLYIVSTTCEHPYNKWVEIMAFEKLRWLCTWFKKVIAWMPLPEPYEGSEDE